MKMPFLQKWMLILKKPDLRKQGFRKKKPVLRKAFFSYMMESPTFWPEYSGYVNGFYQN